MTNPNLDRPQLSPVLIESFAAYYRAHRSWGSLHIVLDDFNLGDDSVRFCIKFAREEGDLDGLALGLVLLGMTRTQRARIGSRAEQLVDMEEMS